MLTKKQYNLLQKTFRILKYYKPTKYYPTPSFREDYLNKFSEKDFKILSELGFDDRDFLEICAVILNKKRSFFIDGIINEEFKKYLFNKNIYISKTKNWNFKYYDTPRFSIVGSKEKELCEYTQNFWEHYIYYEKEPTNYFHVKFGLILGYPKEAIRVFINRQNINIKKKYIIKNNY